VTRSLEPGSWLPAFTLFSTVYPLLTEPWAVPREVAQELFFLEIRLQWMRDP
jgi:hypothetical protein